MFSDDFDVHLIWLGFAWTAYLALHSLLAATAVKAWAAARWPGLGASYRLLYNLLASVLLVPLVGATLWSNGAALWRWRGPWEWVADGLGLLALLGFVVSSRAYDLTAFLGFKSAGGGQPVRLGLSWAHRFVRHPWYFFGLVWLWTRDMDSARLTAALVITIYVVIGSRLEDRKLEQELGASYQSYRARIPGLIPRPWRRLSRAEFEQLRR